MKIPESLGKPLKEEPLPLSQWLEMHDCDPMPLEEMLEIWAEEGAERLLADLELLNVDVET